MIVGLVVALLGALGIALGALQLRGALPAGLRGSGLSAYVNILVGILLLVLAGLRFEGLV
jgi:hypothetical protein